MMQRGISPRKTLDPVRGHPRQDQVHKRNHVFGGSTINRIQADRKLLATTNTGRNHEPALLQLPKKLRGRMCKQRVDPVDPWDPEDLFVQFHQQVTV